MWLSAGGHLVEATSTHFEHRLYPAVDAVDNFDRLKALELLSASEDCSHHTRTTASVDDCNNP